MGIEELSKIADINVEVSICYGCDLAHPERRVLSRGSVDADIMIVGEAPGTEEVKQKIPFCGKAGEELWKELEILNLDDSNTYVTNCVLCRPQHNRAPTNDELSACLHFLKEQIEIVKPKVIIALGGTALYALTGRQGIMKHSGKPILQKDYEVFPIIHPASILHDPQKKFLWKRSWIRFKEYLSSQGKGPTPENVADFAQLHHHSEHSTQDVYGTVKNIVARLKELGFKAGAITDHGTCSGLYSFHEECQKEGIKPILGVEAYITKDHKVREKGYRHIVLLAKNLKGYQNLLKLTTIAYQYGFYYKPRIDYKLLEEHSEGLIALTACVNSVLLLDDEEDEAHLHTNLSNLYEIFKEDLYIELMPHDWGPQKTFNRELISLAKQHDIKMVLTNDCHYIRYDDAEAHDVITSMANHKYDIKGLHIRTWGEMLMAWQDQGIDYDATNFLLNIKQLVDSVEEYEIPTGHAITPDPIVPKEFQSKEHYFADLVAKGFEQKIVKVKTPATIQKYLDRMNAEIETIETLGFMDYFLIIHEYLGWCKENDIAYQCRGSVGGSLVAYCLDFTNIDPIKYGLIFERFISPNRTDLPDIDVDVEDLRRGEVIQHLREVYGNENVAHMEVLIRMSGKLCLREVSRFLKIAYGDVSKISDYLVKASKGDERAYKTIEDSWDQKAFKWFRERYPEVLPLAKKLEGSLKTKGTHAAGVFVAPAPLYTYMPLERAGKVVDDEGTALEDTDKEAYSQGLITAYTPQEGEALGLLKLDVLASNTLTVLTAAEKLLGGIDWDKIGYKDGLTFSDFTNGHTVGVHQFDGGSMTHLTMSAGVSDFEDICALNALHRPGPLESGVAAEYVKVKNGEQSLKKIYPSYDAICKPTYGLIVYQEQVFRILREIGNFEWAEVNKVRKLISKSKGQESIAKYKTAFVTGATDNGLSRAAAEEIFNAIVKYGRYGFNKAHSALYSTVSFRCMYLKTHHPVEYMISLLKLTQKDKLFEYVSEARRLGVDVRPPDINQSDYTFSVYKGKILAGLLQVKGVGKKLASLITKKRPFENIRDFLLRVKLSKADFLSLVLAGAFDSLYMSRKAVHTHAGNLYDKISVLGRPDEQQEGLTSFTDVHDNIEDLIWEDSREEWTPLEKYAKQLQVIDLPSPFPVLDENFYNRFPIELLEHLQSINKIRALKPEKSVCVGWLKTTAKMKNNVRTCTLSDEYGRYIEAVAFKMSEELDNLADNVIVVGHITRNDYRGRTGYVLEKYETILE